jgi:acetyl-CoA carboxylase biotin carboxylase subunit
MTKEFKSVLIANRGEIARRVIRSAKECDIRAIAIHSPHDSSALFAREADAAYSLKGNVPRESYLDQEQVLHWIKQSDAEAVHPGYGFLSENPTFARLLLENGITFIGPSAEAIELLGDKTAARTLARKLGIPTPAGTTEALKSLEEAEAVAAQTGFPVLLKAAAGGGGKGMRVIERIQDLREGLERAKGEALTAFGDDRVYVEKYLRDPRHIEIQILADNFGNVVHLGERECSIQRRHQKLIEESPSPVLTPKLRTEMGEAAVTLIKAAKYTGAGTVEFLLDQEGKYYFLEVNTRLQVEHPVTEFVTGLDLVKEQFRIASGEKLQFAQPDIVFRGHSIEVRIQAEDTWNDFLPSLGKITSVRHPGGQFVRNDSALFPGLEVSGFYDSLLSKLVVWDLDRAGAIKRMERALREMRIVGVSTTIPFAQFTMEHPRFRSGDFSTGFVVAEFTKEVIQTRLHTIEEKYLAGLVRVRQEIDLKDKRRRLLA